MFDNMDGCDEDDNTANSFFIKLYIRFVRHNLRL